MSDTNKATAHNLKCECCSCEQHENELYCYACARYNSVGDYCSKCNKCFFCLTKFNSNCVKLTPAGGFLECVCGNRIVLD